MILFCEPQAPEAQIGQNQYYPPATIETINRYRFLLRNTRKFRQSNLGIMEQVVELKTHLKRNPNDPNLKL